MTCDKILEGLKLSKGECCKNVKNSKTAIPRIRTKDLSFDTPAPQPPELKALCCYRLLVKVFKVLSTVY